MSVQNVLDRLRQDSKFVANVVAWERIPARPAREVAFPARLDGTLAEMLRRGGIEKLYTHQAQAVEAALSGENVVVVTPTASGKTLCYNLPVLQTCLADPSARALYLFPTKALAQDQAAGLAALNDSLDGLAGRVPVHVYDGDTPTGQRQSMRQQSGIIISNPDMLHRGILPHHTRWASFFENLRFVVIDELHAYRGVFGSHVANVLRRMRRICQFYGSSPIFLCASATIANPRELAEQLIEAPVRLIDNNGAPQGEKHFLIYNPPVIDSALGIRRSYTLESRHIAGAFLADEVQTIVFARARLTTEVLLGYLRDEVATLGGDSATVRGYRGGYLPHERRAIEHGLRQGNVRGVVATNALELGVDIGQLGAVIIAGYPGTLASTWQQAGRAGRRADTSAAILVASGAPLDQYIAQHPRYLFQRTVEQARINADNLVILLNHVRCAAFELPFKPGETFGTFGEVTELLNFLAEDEKSLHNTGGTYRWVAPDAPAEAISLRTGTSDTIVIQDVTDSEPIVIGQADRQTAPLMVHVGAVYLHEGRQFIIEALDWENGIAAARQTAVDYYTDASASSTITVIEEDCSEVAGDVIKARGLVEVTWRATGFRMIKRYTHETLGNGEIDLPEQRFETTAYWLYLTPDLVTALSEAGVILQPNDYGPNWQTQRNAARARDGYRCRNCNAPEKPSMQHHVHHLTPFRTFGYVRGQNNNYQVANQLENLVTLCPSCHRAAEAQQHTRSALGGLGNVLRNLATLYLMCEPGDVGLIIDQKSSYTGAPTITLYDNLPAGLGFSDRLYELHDELLKAALELIRDCKCTEGCPACVGPVSEVGSQTKALALHLVESMIPAE
ncbi:MAG: DEAD/DEAH box helicase [Chloroflexota bacterium]